MNSRQLRETEVPLKKPDLSLVLLIVVGLAVLLLITFELWVAHDTPH